MELLWWGFLSLTAWCDPIMPASRGIRGRLSLSRNTLEYRRLEK
jgi:hypothetical protein